MAIHTDELTQISAGMPALIRPDESTCFLTRMVPRAGDPLSHLFAARDEAVHAYNKASAQYDNDWAHVPTWVRRAALDDAAAKAWFAKHGEINSGHHCDDCYSKICDIDRQILKTPAITAEGVFNKLLLLAALHPDVADPEEGFCLEMWRSIHGDLQRDSSTASEAAA